MTLFDLVFNNVILYQHHEQMTLYLLTELVRLCKFYCYYYCYYYEQI